MEARIKFFISEYITVYIFNMRHYFISQHGFYPVMVKVTAAHLINNILNSIIVNFS